MPLAFGLGREGGACPLTSDQTVGSKLSRNIPCMHRAVGEEGVCLAWLRRFSALERCLSGFRFIIVAILDRTLLTSVILKVSEYANLEL